MVYRVVSPISALRDFQRALEASRASDWFGQNTSARGAFPAVNVFAKGDDCVIVAELPGVKKSDINVSVKRNRVQISGSKNLSSNEDVSVHRRERKSGSFDRTLTVPVEVDPEGVRAEYQDGLLAVFLPRAESDKPRSVTVS